jgi:hypothetical protein
MLQTHGFLRRLSIAASLTLAVLGVLAPAAGLALEAQRYGDIPYLSGGIGTEEREQLEAQGRDYNLKLVLARGDGAFVADVRIRINDRGGNPVLEAIAAGPWFYAKLPPGVYQVEAVLEGESRRASVSVPGHAQARLVFHFGAPAPRGID